MRVETSKKEEVVATDKVEVAYFTNRSVESTILNNRITFHVSPVLKCDQIGGTFSNRVLLTCHA